MDVSSVTLFAEIACDEQRLSNRDCPVLKENIPFRSRLSVPHPRKVVLLMQTRAFRKSCCSEIRAGSRHHHVKGLETRLGNSAPNLSAPKSEPALRKKSLAGT